MIRKIFASILIFLFVMLSVPVVLFWGAYSTFLDEDFYEDEFSDLVYEFGARELPKQFDEELLSVLNEKDLRNILRDIISKEEVDKSVRSFVKEFKNAEVDENGEVEIKVPMTWLLSKDDELAQAMAERIYEKLPECEDETELPIAVQNWQCKNDSLTENAFVERMKQALNVNIFANMEEDFSLNFKLSDEVEGPITEIFGNLLNNLLLVSFFVLALPLLLIALIIHKPWLRVLRWEVKAVFLASLFVSVLMLVFLSVPKMWSFLLTDSKVAKANYQFQQNLYDFLVIDYAKNITLWTVFIALVSLIALIIIYRKESKNGFSYD